MVKSDINMIWNLKNSVSSLDIKQLDHMIIMSEEIYISMPDGVII
jgi:DNA repair protein RadC